MKTLLVATAAGAALAVAPFAAADKETVHFTAAGQADAHAATIQRTDLGTVADWTGGTTKPSITSSFPGCNYKPKQSDLVLTGAAESEYGCDCHHSPRVRNRQRKNCPGSAPSSVRPRPLM